MFIFSPVIVLIHSKHSCASSLLYLLLICNRNAFTISLSFLWESNNNKSYEIIEKVRLIKKKSRNQNFCDLEKMFWFIRRLNLCFIMSEISRDFRRSFELEGARATSDCLLLIMRCASDPSNTSCRVCDMSRRCGRSH